jgi:acetyl-CoA C-acetyltransferase
MNAIMNLDQSASLLMTNVENARRLQIPESKWVYVRGCGDAQDHWYISQRQNFFTSPALRRAGERALEQADRSIDDIEILDLYSCFPAAVQLAAEMLGIPTDDPRPRTITGGLPYHGGPGSNYSTHAIACLVERLRRQTGSFGMATGIGWYFTKHSVGVYSTAPPTGAWRRHDVERDQRDLDGQLQATLCERADGVGSIETYTVVHDREGGASLGLAAFRLEDGRRCWARVHDLEALDAMEVEEFVGKPGRIRFVEADNAHVLDL